MLDFGIKPYHFENLENVLSHFLVFAPHLEDGFFLVLQTNTFPFLKG